MMSADDLDLWLHQNEPLLLSFLHRTQSSEHDEQQANDSSSRPHYSSGGGGGSSVGSSSNTTTSTAQRIHTFLQSILSTHLSHQQPANSTFLDGKLYTDPSSEQHFFKDGQHDDEGDDNRSWTSSHGVSLNATAGNVSDDGCSSRSYEYADFTQIDPVRECFVAVYIIVIIVSVLGNLMVMYTVWRNKHMRTTTNYYIVNLAVCDFLVASFVMPLKLLEYVAPCSWQVFGHNALCSIVSFILPVVVFASVLTLVAISIERHRSIMFPLNAFRTNSKTRTQCILAFTWAVPLLFASPYLFSGSYAFNIHSKHGSISRQICNDRFDDIDKAMYGESQQAAGMFRKGFFLFLFFTIYLIPLLVIVSTCVRIARCLLQPICIDQQESCTNGMRMTRRREESKRRVAKMVITVALSFIVCWSPFYWVTLVSQLQQQSFLRNSNFLFTMLSTHLIGFVNSAINPLIYHTMNEKFRKSFRNIFFRVFCCVLPLLNRRRKYSWTTRCDGMSAPYCGYVGSTLHTSNIDPPHEDKHAAKKPNKRAAVVGRPKGPRRHFVAAHKPNLAAARDFGDSHFCVLGKVAEAPYRRHGEGEEGACVLGACKSPAIVTPRHEDNHREDVLDGADFASGGGGRGDVAVSTSCMPRGGTVCNGDMDYLCTPSRASNRGTQLSPYSQMPADGPYISHSHSRLYQYSANKQPWLHRPLNPGEGTVAEMPSKSVRGGGEVIHTVAGRHEIPRQRRWSYGQISQLLVKNW